MGKKWAVHSATHTLCGHWGHSNDHIPVQREHVFYEGQVRNNDIKYLVWWMASSCVRGNFNDLWGVLEVILNKVFLELPPERGTCEQRLAGGEPRGALCRKGVLWGQTVARRVVICSPQVLVPSAVAELTRWGSQNPTTPMFRCDY